jgi:hypothetical protein
VVGDREAANSVRREKENQCKAGMCNYHPPGGILKGGLFFLVSQGVQFLMCFAGQAMNEGETLRWLNEGLKAMWPICMEKFASQHFFKPMAPWFLNKYKPKFVVRCLQNIMGLIQIMAAGSSFLSKKLKVFSPKDSHVAVNGQLWRSYS